MKSTIKFIPLAAVLALASCGPAESGSEASTNQNDTANEVKADAPDSQDETQQGYTLPGLNHGLSQSPINIDTQSMTEDGSHKVTMHFGDQVNKIENLGHTVQLDFQEGSSISVDDTTFNFIQCHFHTPSEHLINGMTYPMEMHIVNVMPDENKEDEIQYLVIGALFKEGKENKFLADFLNKIPKEAHTSSDLEAGTVKLADLFGAMPKDLLGHTYHYRGSLTTPPYTESVRWYITKHIFEASAEQIEAINKIEGNNARHVQATYGRTVMK